MPLKKSDRPSKRQDFGRDLEILRKFIEVYCRERHPARRGLCAECADLLEYSGSRLEKCPYDPKPMCKECPTHCYKPEYRRRIQEVMRFSGPHLAKRGRLDLILRYFLANKKSSGAAPVRKT